MPPLHAPDDCRDRHQHAQRIPPLACLTTTSGKKHARSARQRVRKMPGSCRTRQSCKATDKATCARRAPLIDVVGVDELVLGDLPAEEVLQEDDGAHDAERGQRPDADERREERDDGARLERRRPEVVELLRAARHACAHCASEQASK